MQNTEIVDQIVTAITLQHQKEMADYGSSKFTRRISDLKDRKLLLKLINNEITLDQFITRLNCIEQSIKYYCKDDLLQMGISK